MAKNRPGSAESRVGLIVRRGALRRFDRLKKATADLPVAVLWDRRTSGSEPSVPVQADRRKPAPFTWDAADFVVVEDHEKK